MPRSSEVRRALERLRHDLSPEVLRQEVELPFEAARESFEPRFLTTEDWEEIRAELVRFVCHLDRLIYHMPHQVPEEQGRRSLNQLYIRHPDLERQLENIVLRGERGGMRHALDLITRARQEDRLGAYLNQGVGLEIDRLSVKGRAELTVAYFEAYGSLPHIETDMPEIMMSRWPQMLGKHARFVLGWNRRP